MGGTGTGRRATNPLPPPTRGHTRRRVSTPRGSPDPRALNGDWPSGCPKTVGQTKPTPKEIATAEEVPRGEGGTHRHAWVRNTGIRLGCVKHLHKRPNGQETQLLAQPKMSWRSPLTSQYSR